MERDWDNSVPFPHWQPLNRSSRTGKQLQLNWRTHKKKSKLLTSSKYILLFFFHSSEGWNIQASTYTKMYIFMNTCFIKDWEDESCHLCSVNLFHYFRCSVSFSIIYWEKIALHHFQFTVISHRLSSNRKNYVYSKVITRTYLCILTCFTMNIFEDKIFQHVLKKVISSCAKMKITLLAETLAISAIWTRVDL